MNLLLAAMVWVYILRTPTGPWGLFIRLPTTICHELCHFFVALFLGCRPSFPSIIPRRIRKGWELGSVKFKPHKGAAALVALAPVLQLPIALLLLSAPSDHAAYNLLICAPLAGVMLLGCVPSSQDWSIAFADPVGLVLAAILGIVGYQFCVVPGLAAILQS